LSDMDFVGKRLTGLRVLTKDLESFRVDTKFDSHYSSFTVTYDKERQTWVSSIGGVVLFDDEYYAERPLKSLAEVSGHATKLKTILSWEQLLATVLFYCYRTGIMPRDLRTSLTPVYLFYTTEIRVRAFRPKAVPPLPVPRAAESKSSDFSSLQDSDESFDAEAAAADDGEDEPIENGNENSSDEETPEEDRTNTPLDAA